MTATARFQRLDFNDPDKTTPTVPVAITIEEDIDLSTTDPDAAPFVKAKSFTLVGEIPRGTTDVLVAQLTAGGLVIVDDGGWPENVALPLGLVRKTLP